MLLLMLLTPVCHDDGSETGPLLQGFGSGRVLYLLTRQDEKVATAAPSDKTGEFAWAHESDL
jgi:hypothetical protein